VRGDTEIVRTAGADPLASLATLTQELSIGTVEGDEVYMFGFLTTLAVSADGSIYAYDDQAGALRKYDVNGVFVKQFGRQGDGPGEYRAPTGLAVDAAGQVHVWDPRARRLTVYGDTGEVLRSFSVPSGLFSDHTLTVDSAGRDYVRATLGDFHPGATQQQGFLRYSTTGQLVDTILPPDGGPEPALLTATTPASPVARGRPPAPRASAVSPPPFTPTLDWTLSPLGYLWAGHSSAYRIDALLPGGRRLRVEKDADAVPVAAGEREWWTDIVTTSMRRIDPGWSWNGPPVAETKPYFQSLRSGDDGRLWVRVHMPAVPVPPPPGDTAAARRPPPWREPAMYDVFEPDGSYVGRVAMPLRAALEVMRGDRIWAIARDSLDVQYIRRYRLTFPAHGAPVSQRGG
jgi:hypothetical protein